ncbi:MAG: M20/M25/M40 family metallo-hydrolase [Bacteroidales bacterium]|nr:M20/M25/M40 family metallo-hydrolase [Bacteroidales bacterium]
MKTTYNILVFLFITFLCPNIDAKNKISAETKGLSAINLATAEAHINFLASDALEGRELGTKGGYIAGEYIISVIKQLGANPFLNDNYEQSFKGYAWPNKNSYFYIDPDEFISKCTAGPHKVAEMRNIICKIDGNKKDEFVVIGAHYDHLGCNSMFADDKIFNGADDNASGVQAVLQILKAFIAADSKPERTVIFAFWDGEEPNLLGSRFFVNNFSEKQQIKCYINLDMIGRNSSKDSINDFYFRNTKNDSIFKENLQNDIIKYKLDLQPKFDAVYDLSKGSDQANFFNAGIPIIAFSTGFHSDYHLPSDEAKLINWNKMLEITKAAFLSLWHIANEKETVKISK